jgi:hypothetical protein
VTTVSTHPTKAEALEQAALWDFDNGREQIIIVIEGYKGAVL